MTSAAPKPKTYTAEEYLALEVESAVRSEFRDGDIVEMTGGTEIALADLYEAIEFNEA